jgi:broad specificity phosphatase PhoE
MHLLWIRHAESVGNQAGQIQGQTQDPLTQLGCRQAAQLGSYLQTNTWLPTHVYTSPLPRAQQTAEILMQVSGCSVAVQLLDDLQEIHNGILQGLTWIAAQRKHPDLCQQLESTLEWIAIPGGETPPARQARAQQLIAQLLSRHQTSDRLWLISHGGILPYFLAALLGTPRVWGIQIPFTALFELELNLELWQQPQQMFNSALCQIHRFNETPHFSSPF